jgi:purine-binding chemotaxis protein CheW
MTERTGQTAGTAKGLSVAGPLDQEREKRERRELLVFKAGERRLCVFAVEAQGAVAWVKPTPLPRAPQAVLGVVSIRGRMFTLLDAQALLAEPSASVEHERIAILSYTFIIPLRGDEQLALAADDAPRAVEIFTDEIESSSSGRETSLRAVRGIVRDEDGERAVLLDVQEIFNAAMQGVERRRRRF